MWKNTKSLMRILEYLMSDDILYRYVNSVNKMNNEHHFNIVIKLSIKICFLFY